MSLFIAILISALGFFFIEPMTYYWPRVLGYLYLQLFFFWVLATFVAWALYLSYHIVWVP